MRTQEIKAEHYVFADEIKVDAAKVDADGCDGRTEHPRHSLLELGVRLRRSARRVLDQSIERARGRPLDVFVLACIAGLLLANAWRRRSSWR